VLKLIGSREQADLTPIRAQRVRYFFEWEWHRPRRYLLLGIPESGKSALNEAFAEHHPRIMDLYGSRDDENLCWCRDTSPIDDILLIHGDNTSVSASFDAKKVSDFTARDIRNYEGIVTCHSFYSSQKAKLMALQQISDALYGRRSWREGDIVYLLMRETMNVLYTRMSQGLGEKEAKADLLYFIRELRHFGFSIGADILRWTGADKELRDLADYTIFKQIGEKGLPSDKRYLYNYVHPVAFAQMKPHQFVALRKDGAIALGSFKLPRYHKEEGVDLLHELGITIEHSEEPEDSTPQRVGDLEHAAIVQAYESGLSMEKIAKMKHRSSRTIHRQVNYHNEMVVKYKICDKCRRAGGDLFDKTLRS